MPSFGIVEVADVGDAIHVHLGGVFEEFVHEHRAFGRGFDGEAHVVLQLGVGIDNLHRAPAEHEAGAHQDRIAERLGDRERFGFVGGEAVRRLRDVRACRSIAAKSLRSSAISMLCGEVPMMLTPFFCRPSARFSGVWPPNCAMAPQHFSRS